MLKLAFAVLAGAALGVGATQMLHAQAKPPAFLISDITVTDDASSRRGASGLARHSRSTAGSIWPEAVRRCRSPARRSRKPPSARSLRMFESLDKAKEWDSSEDVKAARAIDRGATFRSYIVEGLPAQ